MKNNANNRNIYDLDLGEKATVRSIDAGEYIRQRLLDMGVLPNCEVVKERTALGGDPVWIRVGNVQLALRKNEAQSVFVD